MSYDAPFAGIKVIDLSQGIAAPYAGMLLAQHGAEVIKVELLDGGDWVRVSAPKPGGNTALSVMGNLGKQSIGVDLKSPVGCAVLWRLLEGADVFMEGFRPGVIRRLGFDYPTVSARFPAILYLSMSGFGQTGPYAERPAMDPVLQAFTGFMAENRDLNGRPMNIASIPVDMITALYAFQALSAALYARRDETHGRYIEASLLQGAAWLNTYAMLQRVIYDGDPPGARAHRGVYPTADGWILVIVSGRRGWGDFCRALEHPELGDDARFTSVVGRVANSADLAPILSEILSARTNAHWQARLSEYGVMHSVTNESLDMLRDPHVEATGLFSHLRQPGLPMTLPIPAIPGAPALQNGTRRATAPLAGADTEAVLRAHGYGLSEIADLRARGVISAAC
ncbi:CaiB/BaiF CoA transferase family protein [Rhodopila sp.]|uniref:CaiB/BaiF CoA transferase family protein n=1 Tax=Rhodopila sp. TaxID=2480087 RepID=UPI003D0E9D7D